MIRWSHPEHDLDLAAPLVDHAVAREQIAAGASTAMLQRLQLPGGTRLVCKHIAPTSDWMMRATNDSGRAAELWVSGTMERCPAVIDPALVRIEDDGADGWRLYMRELSLHNRETRFNAADVQRLLAALAKMHDEFWEEALPCLCTVEQLLSLLAPRTVTNFDTDFLDFVRGGWEIFAELAPDDLASAVFALLEDPSPLATVLEQQGRTLLHADVHFDNAVLEPDRLVLIDWTLATFGPPTVDFVWFLDQSIGMIDATHDEVVGEFLRAERGRVTDEMLDVGCLAELLSSGWQCRHWIDSDRADKQANFDWFVGRARRAL